MVQELWKELDDEELLHLAIEASRGQRHGDAIAYLKQAVANSRTNTRALYILAAEHAQIGLTERAIEGFKQTLDLEPGLSPARFQLGLLYLCNARVAEALEAWKPLEKLAETDPYIHLARGMKCMARDAFQECKKSLERGIALNDSNPALNKDMQRVLRGVDEGLPVSSALASDS